MKYATSSEIVYIIAVMVTSVYIEIGPSEEAQIVFFHIHVFLLIILVPSVLFL